jgi:transcriptional regulator GlxA family with amidase domain
LKALGCVMDNISLKPPRLDRAFDLAMPFEDWQETAQIRPDIRVGFLLWPRFTLLDLACFVEPLRLIADIGDRSRPIRAAWHVMSNTKDAIIASCGLRIEPNSPLLPPRELDYIAVVGGLVPWLEANDPKLIEYLQLASAQGVHLIGLSTGAFIFARAGLLNGRRACVHTYHKDDFVIQYPDVHTVTDEIFVVDGDRITSAGGVSSLDLATHLVRTRFGRDRALKIEYSTNMNCSRGPLAAQRGRLWDCPDGTDRRIRRALLVMEQNLSSPLSVREIARRVNYSDRQLERAFRRVFSVTPSNAYRLMRLRFGCWLLRQTGSSIRQISFDCGFSDASHFGRYFRAEFGQTPNEFRRSAESTTSAA